MPWDLRYQRDARGKAYKAIFPALLRDNVCNTHSIKLVLLFTRDDRIVDFYYAILSCLWNMISVSDPNPVLVETILSVSEKDPKVYCDANHSFFVLCLYCWGYFAFNWTRLVDEVVTRQVWNACPA